MGISRENSQGRLQVALFAAVLGVIGSCRRTPSPPEPAPTAQELRDLTAVSHYVPDAATRDKRCPLLLFLHGYGDNGDNLFQSLSLAEFGKRHQIAVFAPNGSIDREGHRFWDAHPACCNFDKPPVDHVGELRKLVDSILRQVPIDPRQIYVMGYSNGGFMAHRLACELPFPLAGIVSFAGAAPDPSSTCREAASLSVLAIHGDADRVVKFGGGNLFERPERVYGSAANTMSFWAKRLGCQGAPIDRAPFDVGRETNPRMLEPTSFAHCARGSLSLWKIPGGSHSAALDPVIVDRAWRALRRESSQERL